MSVFVYVPRHGARDVASVLRLAVSRRATGIIPCTGIYFRVFTTYLDGRRHYVLQACDLAAYDVKATDAQTWLYTAEKPFTGVGVWSEEYGPWCLVVRRGELLAVAASVREARRMLSIRGRIVQKIRTVVRSLPLRIGYA